MRRRAPWVALTLVAVLTVLVLGAGYLLVPANRPFEYGGGIRLQLLSISHENVNGEERVTWGGAGHQRDGRTAGPELLLDLP
ncbi:hypothetical protein [Nocardiopsis synnemataformans]|uniref:hypothetical protein n=1 Tax=Nocardiopsis synnemataformans TaxID=61305 RepID=UPI003EB91FA6